MKKRLGMLALALCMAVIAVSGGALCTKASAAESNTSGAHKKIMIFSPHQDDEANIAEAIIYSNVKEGNEVYVVMGFGGNATAGNSSDGTYNDFYGVRRLNESTKNLEKLGVQNPQDHIIYLGYHKVDYAAMAIGTAAKIDPYKGEAKYSEQGELLKPDDKPYYTMGDGTKNHGFPYAWKSYHYAKYGTQCTVSEAHMQADIVDILKEYQPDEIYSIDFDSHIEHMYMGSVVDTAFGVLKQDPKFANYQPRFYESMSYQTAWAAAHDLETVKSPSDSSRKILESTLKIDPRNKTLDWNDRVRFPVEKEMSFPDREKNLGYQAYKYGFGSTVGIDTTKPDTGDNYVLGCINGDQVVWERNTQSLSYQATVSVSSNGEEASQINDFSTLRMHMVDFKNSKSTTLNYNDYKWSPATGDKDKTVRLTFKTPQTVGMVKLFDDVSPNNQITSGVLTFSDDSTVDVGALINNGSATEVSFPAKSDITWVEFKIKTFTGTGTPGLSEFEVYSAKPARPADFVKIYLDKVNGSKWANESFLYDYPMRVGETAQSVDLGVYRYPSEKTELGYKWSLEDPPQGIALTQEGRLTVGADAAPGEYSIPIKVTSKSQSELSDTITIDIAKSGSIWPGKGTDADPYLISTQAQLSAITTGKSYKLINDIKLVNWSPISAAFAGTFNGNGYTISNLTAPLFKTVLPAGTQAVTIKNVNLITTGNFAASVDAVGTVFAAIGNGDESAQITVDNVHATINGKVTTSGLVGECGEKNRVKINNCSVVVSTGGSIVDSNIGTSFAGGIIKHMRANTTIENSYVYIQTGGKITANLKDAGSHVGAGGIAATMPYAANSMTQIKNCYVINEGTIQSSKVDGSTPVQGAGGLLGVSYSNSGSVNGRSIANSYVYDSGTIQSVDGAGQQIANRQGCIYGYHSGATGVPSVTGAYFNSESTAPAIGAANSTVLPTTGTVGCTLAEMQAGTKLSLLDINGTGSQWKSAADRAPAGNQAPVALQGLPYLLMENNAQFAPASLTYYKGGVDVTTTVTGGGALQSITKDGVTVDATNYSFTGSTLTIKKAYLGTLAVGKNVLKLTFAEGQPNRELEIEIVPRSGIDEAKQLIINGTYTFTQAAANTEADVKTALVAQISALPGMTATGVTVTAENITVTNFVVAAAGTADIPIGTNGSFKFTVTLSAGGSSGTTVAKAGTITATAYVPATLTGITVTAKPTNTAYTAGEIFDPAGMVVTATYSDTSSKEVTGYTTTPAGPLAAGNTVVTVSYEEGGVTKTATVAITVTAATQKELNLSGGSITITANGYTQGSGAETTYNGDYMIRGTSDANIVKVTGVTHTITLNNVTITSTADSPFQILGGNVTLMLEGDNTLETSKAGMPALQVNTGASLKIDAVDNNQTLSASGNGSSGNGIGGISWITSNGINAGQIEIAGGSVTAKGTTNTAKPHSSGVGIGGGYSHTCDGIKISGGVVNAIGGAVGIGTSACVSMEKIELTGGTITATGHYAGIGCPELTYKAEPNPELCCKNLTIENCSVNATTKAKMTVNTAGVNVYLVTLTAPEIVSKEVSIKVDGGKPFTSIADAAGKLYLYIPAGSHAVSATFGGKTYAATGVTVTPDGAAAATLTEVPATQDKFALSFKVTGVKTEYRPGETITAEIYLAYPGGTNIGSFGTTVGCDSTYLTLTGLSAETGVTVNPLTGIVGLVDESEAGFAIAAAGTKLATATFKVRSDATSSTANLTFTGSNIGDPNGYPLPDAITATPTTVKVVKQDDTASGVSVTGQVTSYNPKNATTVTLKQGAEVKYTATIPAGSTSGQTTQPFTIADVAKGTYDLVVTKAGHLTYTITGVIVAETALDLTTHSNAAISTITLLAGDMNGDHMINSADLSVIWNVQNYNKSIDVAVHKLTDINGDGLVNSADYNTVWNSKNYNKNSGDNCTSGY